MSNFIYLFIIIFFSKELFYFDEELLVVCSFFIVFVSLYRILSSFISSELDMRCNLIYDQFLNYLKAKKDLLDFVLIYYHRRNYLIFQKICKFTSNILLILEYKYFFKIISLNYWFQRYIISKLISLIFLENTFLKKYSSSLILHNRDNVIELFIENYLLLEA